MSITSIDPWLWSGEACDGKNSFLKFDCNALSEKPDDPPANRLHMSYKMLQSDSKLLPQILNVHGLKEVDVSVTDFNFVWSGIFSMPEVLRTMTPTQRINRYPRSFELTRKDLLTKNIDKMRQMKGTKHFNFIPQTFLIPAHYDDLCHAHNKNRGQWIVKPISSSMGRGIYIVRNPKDIPLTDNVVVARYIENPLLIDGHKCDLRIYVVVTSFDPLLIYLYEEGLVRFAALKYDLSGGKLWNPCMHLCNYSVNKYHSDYVPSDDCDTGGTGHKWTMSAWLRYLSSNNFNTAVLMDRIEEVVIKSILSAAPPIISAVRKFVPHPQNCFELYGFDVLVDDKLKPWLLEVNFSPALDSNTPLDMRVKSALLVDCLNLVGVPHVDPVLRERPKLPSTSSDRAAQKLVTGDQSASSIADEKSRLFTRESMRMVKRVRAEDKRRGGFVRIFPTAESWRRYGRFLDPITGLSCSSTMLGEVVDKKQNNNLILHRELFPDAMPPSSNRLPIYERVLSSGHKINFAKNPDSHVLVITNRPYTKEVIQNIYDGSRLSQWQARRTFSRYLTLVSQPLTLKNKKPDTHGEVVIEFLQTISSYLRNPYEIQTPYRELKGKDREAVVSKTLHDFISTYSRDTEVHTLKDEGPQYVNNSLFQEFIEVASESDLERVLTLHTQLYNRVHLYLEKCGGSGIGGFKPFVVSSQAIPLLSSIQRKTTKK